MKKILGWLGSYTFYYVGDLACRITYIKVRDKYLLDESSKLGDFLMEVYQDSMHKSWKIQEWAGLEKPWEEPKKETDKE